jgi:hypothetical protein
LAGNFPNFQQNGRNNIISGSKSSNYYAFPPDAASSGTQFLEPNIFYCQEPQTRFGIFGQNLSNFCVSGALCEFSGKRGCQIFCGVGSLAKIFGNESELREKTHQIFSINRPARLRKNWQIFLSKFSAKGQNSKIFGLKGTCFFPEFMRLPRDHLQVQIFWKRWFSILSKFFGCLCDCHPFQNFCTCACATAKIFGIPPDQRENLETTYLNIYGFIIIIMITMSCTQVC